MNIKEQLKHAESELKQSYKILKRYGIKDPESFMDHRCGGDSLRGSLFQMVQSELGYAYYQRGKITILKIYANELNPKGGKNK
jgi:hypothetical protein